MPNLNLNYLAKALGLFVCALALGLSFDLARSDAAFAQSEAELAQSLEKLLREKPNLILDVLRRNSELVLDIAQQGSNLRRKHNLEAQWREDLKKPKEVRLEGRPVLGDPQAKVRIVEFSDFSCNYCQQASKTIDNLLKDYGKDVKVVFKHLPMDEKGPGGVASEWFCAIAMQSEPKAWQFYKEIFANRDRLLGEGEPYVKETAQKLGVDMKRAAKDLQSKKLKTILSEDAEDAQKLGVEGTPYFLVNDLIIRGALPPELFKAAVELALKEKKK